MSKRYFLLRIVCDRKITAEQFRGALLASMVKHFGEVGTGLINMRLVRYDAETAEAVVVCEKERVNELLTALSLLRDASGTVVAAITLRVSGTIRSLRKKSLGNLFHSDPTFRPRG